MPPRQPQTQPWFHVCPKGIGQTAESDSSRGWQSRRNTHTRAQQRFTEAPLQTLKMETTK